MTGRLSSDHRSRITNHTREVLDCITRLNRAYGRLNGALRDADGSPDVPAALAAAVDRGDREVAFGQLDRVLEVLERRKQAA